jgi:ribonuclease BN (tRNA processing enzyme)
MPKAGLRLLPLGVGDAFSTLHYSTCLALEAEGAWLLLDCPHPLRKMMHEAAAAAGVTLDVENLTGIALTHLHADHCSGLESAAFYARHFLGRRLEVLVHPDVGERLWAGHLAAGMERVTEPGGASAVRRLEEYANLRFLDESATVTIGPFAVECRRTIHHIPTTALRVRAGGRALSFSADTVFDPGLVEWLSAADLVIHESNVGPHTPYERLAALPRELRCRMRLIHCPDGFRPPDGAIELLAQGRLLDV